MLEINEEGVKQVVSVGEETPNYREKQQPSKSRFSLQKSVLPKSQEWAWEKEQCISNLPGD